MPPEPEASGKSLRWVTLHLSGIYVVVALLVCTAFCVLTPPFDVPDESFHAERAMQIARGELLAEKTAAGVGGATDVNFSAVVNAMSRARERFLRMHGGENKLPEGRVSAEELAAMQAVPWAHRTTFSIFQTTAVYSPVLYLPQAIGWRLGEAADFTIVRSLQLARVFAAWCAIAIGWLTLRMCTAGRWLMFAYLLLPTELSLVSSCSQDALLMSVAGLTAVLIWRTVGARRMLTRPEMVVAACLMAVCVTARVPYLPMSLALLLPALEAEGRGWRKLVPGAQGVGLVVALVGGWQMAVHRLGTFVGPEASPALQVAFLRGHPLLGVRSLLYATSVQVPVMVAKGLYLLGYNDAVPPDAVRLMLMVGAGAVVLLNLRAGVRSWAARMTLGAGVLGTVAAIWLAEYVIWTPPGSAHVIGLQTRYFLPLLPFVFLLCPERWAAMGRGFGLGRPLGGGALLGPGGIFVGMVMYAPWTAAHVFYGKGLVGALRLVLFR